MARGGGGGGGGGGSLATKKEEKALEKEEKAPSSKYSRRWIKVAWFEQPEYQGKISQMLKESYF